MKVVCLAVASAVWIVAGCKRNAGISAPPPMGSDTSEVSSDRIAKLAASCAPESRAELVAIAGSTASHALRCQAMKSLADLAPGPAVRLFPYTQRNIETLAAPSARDALLRMLGDREPWCRIERGYIFGDQPTMVSPTQVALWVLTEFPVPSLRKDVDAVPSSIEQRAGALREYAIIDKRHDSPAVTYIDGLTADGSTSGFEHLIQFVADGEPWPASIQRPTDADVQEVHAHVLIALEWLRLLAGQSKDDVRYPLDCVQDIKAAVRTGRLGALLISRFAQFDPEVRVSIMNVFFETGREGARSQVEKIATSDPDAKVREAAEHALLFVDKGGYSNVDLNGGSASH